MKKIMLIIAVFAISFCTYSQIQTPQPSTFTKIEQEVGLTDVTLEYSRPNMRNRVIFGDLVPYDKVWRTGANSRTKISFSDDVKVGDATLKAGTYAIFTIPGKTSWDVIFYTEHAGGGAPQTLDETKVAARVKAEVYPLPMKIETFTISFDDLTSDSASIGIMWENVYVGVQFNVPTAEKASASINKVMAGPSANDYYSAAVYYAQDGNDIKKAKEWIDKAISMSAKPQFWQLRQQSLIYAKAGDKKGAIEIAKKSLAASEEAKNDDYIKMNKDSLKEWGAM
jgi:hypothetical protein